MRARLIVVAMLCAVPAVATEAPPAAFEARPVCQDGEVGKVWLYVRTPGAYVVNWPRNVCRLGDA